MSSFRNIQRAQQREIDILLVTTSDDAFATILAALNENNAVSHEAVKEG